MNTETPPNFDVMEPWVTPPVNICETKDAIVVEAEMPGVDKERLEVSIDNDELIIIGRRARENADGQAVWQEIPRSDYRRVFTLGNHIDRTAIHASFEAGILRLRLGKSEEVKPRKIEVQFQ